MKKEPLLQVSKRRNKARWQERLLIRFIALILALIVCGAVFALNVGFTSFALGLILNLLHPERESGVPSGVGHEQGRK